MRKWILVGLIPLKTLFWEL